MVIHILFVTHAVAITLSPGKPRSLHHPYIYTYIEVKYRKGFLPQAI